MTWTANNRSKYILVSKKPQWCTLCISTALGVNSPWKKQYQKYLKSMLHLAVTYRKRTYIVEFGTLDNPKKFITHWVFCTEYIHTATTSAYMIILPSWVSYLNC